MIFTKDRLLNALERIRQFSTGTYTYDANGNTTYDPANQISTVYNYLNLPSKFTKDNGATQEVVYDATGRKWQVREFLGNGDTLSRKSYIGSFEFERNTLQRAFHPTGFIQNLGAEINSSGQANGNLEGGKIISTQKLKSGIKSEYIADQSISLLPGFESDPVFHAEIKPKSGYQWNYILRDHLGNTRVVFADKNKDGLIRQDRSEALNEVLSLSNYSPFGLELGGSHQNLKQQFEYKFNGKQENGFSGLTDFGGRYLDRHLGVWAQVDPLAEKLPFSSPYAYALNNPLKYIDPDGRLPIIPWLLKAGAGAAADMMAQASMDYLFNSNTKSWGQAFDNVNYYQVARSGAEGLIPWRTPGGKIGKAAGTAIADVLFNAANNPGGYTSAQAGTDFATAFIGDLAGGGFGQLLNKYGSKSIINGLMDKMGYNATQIRKITGGFDGDAVRKWYKSTVDGIDINVSPTEANARNIVGQRNLFKQQARDLMFDQKAANNLPAIESYDYYYNKSYNKGLRGDALYQDIINGGKKTNANYNKKYGE
ncbi:MAG: RHS repeat domain-containing protein [Spirosomataceae bacterium]